MIAIVLSKQKRCYYPCFTREQTEAQWVNNLQKVMQPVRNEAQTYSSSRTKCSILSTVPPNLPKDGALFNSGRALPPLLVAYHDCLGLSPSPKYSVKLYICDLEYSLELGAAPLYCLGEMG